MTNKLDLNAIRKRAEAVTEGPWKVFPYQMSGTYEVTVDNLEVSIASEIDYQADAEFIASARTDVVELIAEVERLRQALWEITVYPSEDALEIAEEALEHGR
ncbi:hypothetical protein KYJ26_16975 [Bacillus sp. MCCB 382]|uniref:hypothetical protein n=1 Tax=Bacillus sp. MCCB 382 TaxID=2860197 RepID=UPI001C596124|nr:hypothetical protein [Bacillus sp. MCCB 382]